MGIGDEFRIDFDALVAAARDPETSADTCRHLLVTLSRHSDPSVRLVGRSTDRENLLGIYRRRA
jgi:hypothetical protein